MIKNLLLIGFVFVSMQNIAQPTLTAANTNMVLGETGSISSYNWVAPGNSGANQIWNFSALTTNTTGFNGTYTITTIPSSITAQYPNANIAYKFSYGYDIYKISNSSWQSYGHNSNFGTQLIYQDPADKLRYPFTFGDTYTDTFIYSQGSLISKRTSTVTADGYGTIILPGGTFSNVLRVYSHSVGKDSSSPSNQYNIVSDYYFWIMPNIHYPILQNTIYNSSGTIYNDLKVLNFISSGIFDPASVIKSFNIYPNPNNGKTLYLDLNLTENAKYEIAIIDNLGREVLKTSSDQIFEGYNFRMIDVSGLESGIYNVSIILENGKSLNRKITIQK